MNLDDVAVVLCRPEESRNVGAVCRSMANSGIHDLRIVGRREDFDDERVRILAIHAGGIWDGARFYGSIAQATADCTCAAGTTRRRGKKRVSKLLMPEELVSFAQSQSGKCAIVFGNERTGLTDDEMQQCTVAVTIPSSPEFASLNLSHAVQIVCYHFFRSTQKDFAGYTPVTLERLDQTIRAMTDDLAQIGFFTFAGRDQMEHFWRTVLSRAALSEGEAQYIEKIFDRAAGLAKKNAKCQQGL